MEKNICEEKHRRVDEKINTNEKRINTLSQKVDIIELDILAQKKDTSHLQDAIKALKDSIDLLIEEIAKLKSKPLEKYEKIVMIVISVVIGYLASRMK